ncbi:MAG: septum formation protein Maf [Planctomycetaceae bacterium]|nr:septum formation protein Maf [Planctomycetaceae bacterium]
MSAMKLILASQSERRRDLLSAAAYEFEIILPHENAECGICSRETPPELVGRLAYQKAMNVAGRVREPSVVIGCDTIAECQGQIMGKPVDRKHAHKMLSLMSGRVHHVYSGLCLWRRPDDRFLIEVDVTKLQMDPLIESQLEAYLDTDAWQGKAGALGFQDGPDWLTLLDGSESNVVGLPMELLERMMVQMEKEPRD